MAEMLKRENLLMSLRVTLEFWSTEPKLSLSFEHGGVRMEGPWEFSPQAVGVPLSAREVAASEPAPRLTLPAETLTAITALADRYAEFDNEPLWLHLVPPYGYTGLLPWEQVLGDATGRPVLRLPDFLERSREDPHTLVAAIVYDPSAANWDGSEGQAVQADERVRALVEAVLTVPRDRVIVHLFTTVNSPRLRWFDLRIQVHQAAQASPDANLAGGGSPWLEWIAGVLESRPPDLLHFVCGADLWDQAGALLLRGLPISSAGSAVVSTLQPSELSSFMTRIGAWATMVSPLPGTTNDSAWRYFADCLALLRPGPALMVALEDGATTAAALYGFVLSPRPAAPPAMGRSFLYCQPALVAGYADEPEPAPTPAPPLSAITATTLSLGRAVDQFLQKAGFQGQPSEPNWASTTQRYIEKSLMDIQRVQKTLDTQGFDKLANQYTDTTSANTALTQTMQAIQQIVDKQTKSTSGGD